REDTMDGSTGSASDAPNPISYYAGLVRAELPGRPFAPAWGRAAWLVPHDALHGSVVRQPFLQQCIGWLGFLPLTVSPTHWAAWHNKVHHRHTMRSGVDPDAFPTIEEYAASSLIRFGDHLTFGAGRLRGLLGLV